VDQVNYRILNGFKLKNVTDPAIPLSVTGGWIVDDTTGYSIDTIDTSGGTIFNAPDHITAISTPITVITGDVSDIAAQVQAGLAAQGYTDTRATKIDSIDDVKKLTSLIPALL